MRRTVEVRRNVVLLAGVGGVSALVAAAYLSRAVTGGSVVDVLLAVALGALAVLHLGAALDSRAPLLVADDHGVRARVGRTWLGFPWAAVSSVELRRPTRWRDGRLTVHPEHTPELTDRRGRVWLHLTDRLYGAPVAVPLGLVTRVRADGPLDAALARLAGDLLVCTDRGAGELRSDDAVVPAEAPDGRPVDVVPRPVWRDPRPALAAGIGRLAGRLRRVEGSVPDEAAGLVPAAELPAAELPTVPSVAPSPLRSLRPALRSEVRLEHTDGQHALAPRADDVTVTLPELEELRRPSLPELDDLAEAEPVPDPVIGPELAVARTRLRLSVEELAGRTRIRSHVIEAIEVDDFSSCGGDFYARGHVRTLARVLGVDATPLIAAYDQRYAQAPVSPQRIFEAELGSGSTGALHSTRSGPNWSVLVAAVMAVVLAWSIARLVVDGPIAPSTSPSLGAGSGGLSTAATSADKVSVVLRAAGGGAHVVVRDGKDRIVLQDDLAYGASRTLEAVPPVRVDSSDGSLVVTVAGQDRGPLGETGQGATGTFVASR